MIDYYVKERISVLLEFIRYDYPRAAAKLRQTIGTPYGEKTFEDLLMYSSDEIKQGFQPEIFSAIMELHDIHKQIMRS